MARERRYQRETLEAVFTQYFVGAESSEGEVRMYCPVCEDPGVSQSPSASMNLDKGFFNCMKSNHGSTVGRLIEVLKKEKGFDLRSARMAARNAVANPRKTSASVAVAALPDEAKVSGWVTRLLSADAHLAALMNERGFSVETIKKWQIGWDGQRYTIPVRDEDGEIVNVRRYKMKAGLKEQKMLNIPGHGTGRVFRPDLLAVHDEIVLCEGETDCILLNQSGIPTVTHTSGASTFKAEWVPLFKDKIVFVCYDNDDGGAKGSAKVARMLAKVAKAVYIVKIPINTKGADVTDYLVNEGNNAEDFRELMEEARAANPVAARKDRTTPIDGKKVSLEDSMSPENANEPLEVMVTVAGKQNPPYVIPKQFKVSCDMSKGAQCAACPVGIASGELDVTFNPDDEQLFRYIEAAEARQRLLMKEVSGARCSDRSEFRVEETYTMEELIVSPSIDDRDSGRDAAPMTRRIYSVNTYRTPVNSTRKMLGRNVSDPKNSRQSFMAWNNEPVKTTLDTFEPTPEMLSQLSKFRPGDNDGVPESPLEKCKEIARDLEKFVTRIYGRELLHVAYDLVWHSPLSFEVEGRRLDKGWLEMMVVGDTRTGKSETAERLTRHYSAGVLKSCEGATFAGLVGGVQQIGNSWTTTWGVIPLNDRRLVILDEVSGLKDKDVIENMSSIRSSGVAQITKIANESTSARTRLIWITNPGDGSMISDHSNAGMDAIKTVVKANEDLARFDFAMAATKDEVDSGLINSVHEETGRQMFDSESCHNLVLWAWSLKPEQIQFTESAEETARAEAQAVGRRYVSDPPLLQTENARFKLYRIAAALAARTFSSYDGGKTLLVTADHVRDAVRFLDEIYSFDGMGYARHSRRSLEAERVARERRASTLAWLKEREDTVLHALKSIGGTTFRVRDFREFAGMTDDDAQLATKWLIKSHMVVRKTRGDMGMTKQLVMILRDLEDEEEGL